ncbi:MAG: hypothetical protein ABI333_25135 [bacterium]
MKRSIVAIGLLSLILGACSPTSPGTNDNNDNQNSGQCNANAAGHYLAALGNFDVEIASGTTIAIRALLLTKDDGTGETGGPAVGATVTFTLISITGDGQLSASTAATNDAGLAEVEFTATEAATYQITASADDACPVTFSVDVVDQLRGLRVLGVNPVTTFTNRRINLTVQAYSPDPGFGEYPLMGETITFVLGPGGTGTALENVGGTQSGAQIDAVTGPNGTATVALLTGTVGIPAGLDVTATLQGTAPKTIHVIVQETGTGPCQSNADCSGQFPICDNGTCVENPAQTGPCVNNDDCVAPYVCVSDLCVAPNPAGQPCNPTTANPCPAGEICIAGFCTEIPTGTPCVNNDDCPLGWLCLAGLCQQDIPPGETACTDNTQCPSQMVCVSGLCVNLSQCQNPPPADRLQGTWQFDSTLHLRDALSGFVSGILTASETLRDIIQGNLNIGGVPGWVEDLIEDIIQSVINAYVPPWAQQLIIAMGNISDIIDDMRVYSTVTLISQGNYEYVGTKTWDIVEFEYQGQLISEDPANIPEIGYVPAQNFTSREICEIFYIDRFDVENVVGGLIRWAVEAMLTAVTCSVPGWPCYYSLEDALEDMIDCDEIAFAIDDVIYNATGFDVYDLVYDGCDALKGPAINAVINWLDNIEVTLSLLTLRGMADIQDDWHLINGNWYGTLAGGNFDGEFTADR